MSEKLRWAAAAVKNNQSNRSMVASFEKFAGENINSVCKDVVKPAVERNLELLPEKVKAVISNYAGVSTYATCGIYGEIDSGLVCKIEVGVDSDFQPYVKFIGHKYGKDEISLDVENIERDIKRVLEVYTKNAK